MTPTKMMRRAATIPDTITQRGGRVSSSVPMELGGSAICSSRRASCAERSSEEFTRQCVDVKACCLVASYTGAVPKLWNETIEAHRRAVRDATLDTAAALVAKHGLVSVTMSQIAKETGIGRATLYKYFSDVEAILVAWHERQISGHLEYLAEVRDRAGTARERLEAVLEAYALIRHEHHGSEFAAVLHRGKHVARAEHELSNFIRDLLIEGAAAGDFRDDVPPEELASYCLHAPTAASGLPSKAAVRRLVAVTLAGLRPPP